MACEDATRLIEVERERGSTAFIESAYLHRAYSLIKLGKICDAEIDMSLIKDEGPFWIEGRCWSRAELVTLMENSSS